MKSGAVLLMRPSEDRHGDGIAWAVRRSGTYLGLEALVRDTYVDTARVISEAVVCGAPRSAIATQLEHAPASARRVLEQVLATQCDDSPRRAGSDGAAPARVAMWLLEEASQEGGRALPRQVVAVLLGMQPETLSRALATLASRGAIDVTRRTIGIRDRDALERVARGAPG